MVELCGKSRGLGIERSRNSLGKKPSLPSNLGSTEIRQREETLISAANCLNAGSGKHVDILYSNQSGPTYNVQRGVLVGLYRLIHGNKGAFLRDLLGE